MFKVNHPISCIQLSKGIFDDAISDHDNSNSLVLISPMGNAFVLGDVDDIEVFEVEEFTFEYKIKDAAGTVRVVRFIADNSDYGILLGQDGYLQSTTGAVAPATSDSSAVKDWYKVEVGLYKPSEGVS